MLQNIDEALDYRCLYGGIVVLQHASLNGSLWADAGYKGTFARPDRFAQVADGIDASAGLLLEVHKVAKVHIFSCHLLPHFGAISQ